MSRSRPASLSPPLTPRVKVWLEVAGDYAFGQGMSEILQAVERTGSIKLAAVEVGRSYRHVWGRIKQVEQTLGRPLVETRVGGQGPQRSALTPEAHRLIARFLAFRERLFQVVTEEFADRFP